MREFLFDNFCIDRFAQGMKKRESIALVVKLFDILDRLNAVTTNFDFAELIVRRHLKMMQRLYLEKKLINNFLF